jgi:uncharacterized protein YkwD
MTCTRSFAIACAAAGVMLALLLAPAADAAGSPAGRLLAPASACPHQTQAEAQRGVQLRAMRCLTNYARVEAGLQPLAHSRALHRAANRKAADIVRCDEFSHEACGREFTYWLKQFGYIGGGCWTAAENIAWGNGRAGSPRAIFRAWLHSPGHRENILGDYAELGVGLRNGRLEGHAGARVWVQEFGSHACSTS